MVYFEMHLFSDGKKSHVLCRNNNIRKIVNDGLSKTLVRDLSYWIVWVDETSIFFSFWSGELAEHGCDPFLKQIFNIFSATTHLISIDVARLIWWYFT